MRSLRLPCAPRRWCWAVEAQALRPVPPGALTTSPSCAPLTSTSTREALPRSASRASNRSAAARYAPARPRARVLRRGGVRAFAETAPHGETPGPAACVAAGVSAEYRCAPPAKVPRVCRACWGKSNSRPQCHCLRTLIAAGKTAGPARSRNRKPCRRRPRATPCTRGDDAA
jgi:hypothetical protein